MVSFECLRLPTWNPPPQIVYLTLSCASTTVRMYRLQTSNTRSTFCIDQVLACSPRCLFYQLVANKCEKRSKKRRTQRTFPFVIPQAWPSVSSVRQESGRTCLLRLCLPQYFYRACSLAQMSQGECKKQPWFVSCILIYCNFYTILWVTAHRF